MNKILLSILVLSFSFTTQAQIKKAVGDKIIATVSDEILLYSDIKNAFYEATRNGEEVSIEDVCKVLQQWLVTKILVVEALKESIVINEEELESRADRVIKAMSTLPEDDDSIGVICWQPPTNSEKIEMKKRYIDAMREYNLADAMKMKILENVRITPAEVKAFYDRVPKDSLLIKSLTEIHVMNLKDDYERIYQMAFLQKQQKHLDKWILGKLSSYHIEIDNDFRKCELVRK